MTDAAPPVPAHDAEIGAAVLMLLRQQGVDVPRRHVSLSRLGWRVRRLVEGCRPAEPRA